MSTRTIASLIDEAAAALQDAGIPEPRREASSLMEFTLERGRSFVIAHPDHEPNSSQTAAFLDFVARRARREPFHYITGEKEFYGLIFRVSPAVLIPRPETEMLVEQAVNLMAGTARPRFCEVGVGSGCISIAVLANVNVKRATAVGLEISDAAIDIARENAERLNVAERFEIRRSDVFDGLEDAEKFDLIVSNPPYVPAADIAGLQPEVRDHEPTHALTDGGDGLSVIKRIVAEAPKFLAPGGALLIEIGIGQADAVARLFQVDTWLPPELVNDLQHIPRTVSARLAEIGETS